jgi:ketosteroid isomerase-like protein
MSQENIEVVRAIFDDFARGDFSRWFSEVTDDFVFVTSPELPDAGTYTGEAARRWVTAWVDSFEGHTMQATEFIDAGDRVFLEILQRGRAHGSRVPVEGRWWVVVTLREAAVARTEVFRERAPAVEAAGLQE